MCKGQTCSKEDQLVVCVLGTVAEDYMPALENIWRGVDFLCEFY